jgi:HEAT repeat protein
MLGQLGDLRALEVLHAAARTSDINVRGAAILSLAELGDERAIGLARSAIAESDARLRAAAGEAFVLLAAPERFKAVAALVSDEATTAIGVHLAERVHNAEITKLLAARALTHPDRELRASAIRALGRSPDPGAAIALAAPALVADPTSGYEAALALARSPAPNALDLVTALASGKHATLGVRAYVVRALVRGERRAAADDVLRGLSASKDGRARALGVFGSVALGEASVEASLGDPDARVRRAAVMGTLARPSSKTSELLLSRIAKEPDPVVRQLLALGLVDGDPKGIVTTTALVDRAESGGADAALSVYALMRRADESLSRKVDQHLASKDGVLRVHAARGLAVSPLPDASGRLAGAYAYETDVMVRRAIISALAARTQDASAPARKETLETASQLDPDGPTRQAARRGLLGSSSPFAPPIAAETAWLRVTLDGGAAPSLLEPKARTNLVEPKARTNLVEPKAPTNLVEPFVGSLVRSDGIAVPLAFDDDGFAVVGGLPPGDARLVLAPRLPSYKAEGP